MEQICNYLYVFVCVVIEWPQGTKFIFTKFCCLAIFDCCLNNFLRETSSLIAWFPQKIWVVFFKVAYYIPKYIKYWDTSNSSDTFTNSERTTNLRIYECFQRKWMLLFTLTVHNNKKTNSVSWKIRRFVVTKNSWNHLMNSI